MTDPLELSAADVVCNYERLNLIAPTATTLQKGGLMDHSFLRLGSLFFFSMGSAGFILSLVKYRRGSFARLWGIRFSHLFGFVGLALLRLSSDQLSENGLLILSSLVVSLIAFEVSSRFLEQE